jgi:outer membrane lipopolysaccharide assembly protein LptE/RlpB
MKKLLVIALCTALAACGYGSRDNELIAQVKKVTQQIPITCPGFTAVDLSLGVMRNGVGSMSKEDVWMTVTDKDQIAKLQAAAESGQIVIIKYDDWRWRYCTPDSYVTSVELTK